MTQITIEDYNLIKNALDNIGKSSWIQPRDLRIIWATGFYEGEGSCGVYSSGHRFVPRVSITQSSGSKDAMPLSLKTYRDLWPEICSNATPIRDRYSWQHVWQINNIAGIGLFFSEIGPFMIDAYKINQARYCLQNIEERFRNIPKSSETHFACGHPKVSSNIYKFKVSYGNGTRERCRTCVLEQQKKSN